MVRYAASSASLSLTLLSVVSAPAWAQDADPTGPADAADSAATPVPADPSFEIHGFVDGSMVVSLTNGAGGQDPTTFGLDQAEVWFDARPAEAYRLRLDVNMFPSAGGPLDVSFDGLVEQAFFDLGIGAQRRGFITFGKQNAPMGVEMIDALDMFQYSYSQLFENATPGNLTGLFGGYRGANLDAMLMATADWDTSAFEGSPLAGLRVAYHNDMLVAGLSATLGPVAEEDPRTMIDADVSVTLGDLLLWAEANVIVRGSAMGWGVLGKANYSFTDSFSLTGRVDYLDHSEFVSIDGADVSVGPKGVRTTVATLWYLNDFICHTTELNADFADGGDPVAYLSTGFTASF